MIQRRVIFVDPELWTTHKENIMTDGNLTAIDFRLAAALTKHHRKGNATGVTEIVRETIDTDRGTPLLAAILDLHARYITDTRTDTGIGYLARHVQAIGAIDPTDATTLDIHRACHILDGHGRTDYELINTALRDAVADQRGTYLVIALLDLYEAVLPEMSSPAGKAWLDACITTMLGEEGEER